MTSGVLLQFVLCPLVFLSLLWTTAPYGRHFTTGWGFTLSNRFAWFVMELPALLVISLLLWASPATLAPVAWVPWLMWGAHYSYRTLVFPFLMRPSGKSFPALLVLFAIVFNALNGYNNAGALIANSASGAALWSIHFCFGSLMFLTGLWIHIAADHTIRKLRHAGSVGYGVPQGGLFNWVSNPHYLGEMIQWSGWAILTWSWAGLAFALFTICNLVPRAMANQRWYRETFPDYPPERKILVPGVF
jgi:protein-S-isoprenylcysteine O-methyltransferase Ste14